MNLQVLVMNWMKKSMEPPIINYESQYKQSFQSPNNNMNINNNNNNKNKSKK